MTLQPGLPILARMPHDSLSTLPPHPHMRAPRLPDATFDDHGHLYLAPPALQGAVAAIVIRDTRGQTLNSAQRLTHYPASPFWCLAWYQGATMGHVENTPDGPHWRPFAAQVVVCGTQSQPTVSWAPGAARAGMICFTADIAQALFGLDLSGINDRVVDAYQLLGTTWQPLLDGLLQAADDAATLALLEQHLAAPWQACQGRSSASASLRQIGRYWVERLARQAHEWQRGHSTRQVERRIKAHSGRSLRQWQSLVRTEGVFFRARDRFEAGLPFDWVQIALDEGFADQAHLSRSAKRITGFAPSDFAQRFVEDESFWLYRLWV